ncbi:hypothetical protein BOS5A_130130 [Bosea sp. EC-HK365B]|nr:hypothetical protein BOSE21B_111199 [Bosea sp. 21B]CAD5272624.1 hypothetical protein BOSE7B_30197 [Bosea sp. 7B]VVT56024.1 hypothetical protein BOS5A_130130 [Bosea sp. EC-HK365B]VXC70905.1 conserved hypothetical protein [Bosea sp. 127]
MNAADRSGTPGGRPGPRVVAWPHVCRRGVVGIPARPGATASCRPGSGRWRARRQSRG